MPRRVPKLIGLQMPRTRLDGLPLIADYLKVSILTVSRLWRFTPPGEDRIPLWRLTQARNGRLYAWVDELDAWQDRQSMKFADQHARRRK